MSVDTRSDQSSTPEADLRGVDRCVTTHTPGPWTLQPCSHGGMLLRRGDQMGRQSHIQSSIQILPEADAHLIAAAPDYHAAAQAIEAHSAVSAASDNIILIPRADYDALLAAHAKAEGRTK